MWFTCIFESRYNSDHFRLYILIINLSVASEPRRFHFPTQHFNGVFQTVQNLFLKFLALLLRLPLHPLPKSLDPGEYELPVKGWDKGPDAVFNSTPVTGNKAD